MTPFRAGKQLFLVRRDCETHHDTPEVADVAWIIPITAVSEEWA